MELPAALRESSDDRAEELLRLYYSPLTDDGGGFTGGQFDWFDPSGTRADCANTFTSDDLMSLALLSEGVSGRAAYDLLVRNRRLFEALLEDVGPDRDLVHETSVDRESFTPAWRLWEDLQALPGLSTTRVSKLMARKRPRLFPILDSVVRGTVFLGVDGLWNDMWASLRADDLRLHKRLLRLRDKADLGASVSALRVFDVCAWMEAHESKR